MAPTGGAPQHCRLHLDVCQYVIIRAMGICPEHYCYCVDLFLFIIIPLPDTFRFWLDAAPDAGQGIEKPDSAVVKPHQKERSNAAFGNRNGVTEF